MSRPLAEVVERALSLSRADDCIVIGSQSSTANVRWANNTSTTNGLSIGTALHVVSVLGGRVGSIGITSPTLENLESVVRRSEEACDGRPEAEDAMPLLPGDGAPAGWTEPTAAPGIGVFATLAPALGDAFRRAAGDDILLFGYAEHATSTTWLATSTGMRRRHTHHDGRLEINAKTPDFARSCWVGLTSPTFADVDVDALYDHLAERLGWTATTVDLPADHYDVLLEPSAVADMLYYLYVSSSAREAEEGRTVFSRPDSGTRIGEQLYPASVNIHSDPAEPGIQVMPFVLASSSSSFASVFDNGLAVGRTQWVRDGVLEALVSTRHWAAISGGEPHPYVDNLVLDSPSGADLAAMIAATTTPTLLVTCFWYIRDVDPQTLLLTGLTRDGVYLVEDGKVQGAVNNFRFNMSPVDMLARVVEMGATGPALPREFGDYFRNARVPPLRVQRFNMSSVSQAT
ncbi:MAG TPA: metallopeptidase TldD-related protein [Acidimicrobiales bacterium]|nr:metallopeptidase TldD-related protein [Acidimicrobiales bacterium]